MEENVIERLKLTDAEVLIWTDSLISPEIAKLARLAYRIQ